MILLLSGATHPESEQRDVMKSTGGYISSTLVPNGGLNVLFDDISCYGQNKKIQDTIAVFLKNDSNQTRNNIILQQIYSNNLGVDSDCVKFKWAAIEPKDYNYIEKIGNRRELPYNAEFFDPIAKREDACLKILTPGNSGDVVNVLGVDSILLGNEKSDVVFAIVESFEDDEDYTVEAKSDEEIYFRRKALIFTQDLIELITPGNATAESTNFSGGKDEGVLLIEEMLPGETIGLWISRKIKKPKDTSCEVLEEEYDELFGDEFSEEEVIDHVDNEDCHEVIFSWD